MRNALRSETSFIPRCSRAIPKPRVASAFQSETNGRSSSSACDQAISVYGESRERRYVCTPAASNSALLSRRSSASVVQVDDQANRKKMNRAVRSATKSASSADSRGATKTCPAGMRSPGWSTEASLLGQSKDRACMPGGGRGRKLARGQLDDERGLAGEAMVLPVRRGPGRPAQRAERLAGQPRIAPSARDARPPGAHDCLRLVEPDRHVRPELEDQPPRDPRLALGERPRPRILGVPAPADRPPLRREVPVQVDAAPVLSMPPRVPVGVELVDEPHVCARLGALEDPCHLDALAFVSVDAADDEEPRTRGRVADADSLDHATAVRATKGSHAPPVWA